MLMRSTLPAASSANANAARESLPPENETVTERLPLFPSSRNLRISFTAVLWILFMCPRLHSTNSFRPASGDIGTSEGGLRSRIFTALSASFRTELSSRAIPGPTLPPFLRMSGSPFRNSPTMPVTLAPGTVLPLRCPDIPANVTILSVATGANMSAPGCLRSMTMRLRLRS